MSRVHVTLEELLRLRHRAKGFSFLPRQPVHSLLTGRHASRLRGPAGGHTAVVLEAARPADVASLYLDALGLTPAQSRVASLVLQGRSTQQIVNELRISSHTVQEHLRAVFDKVGVASRRELVAHLLGDH